MWQRHQWKTSVCIVGIALAGLAVGTGCPGFDFLTGPPGPTGPEGPEGPAGSPGLPGRDAGNDLPGTVVTIMDVSGASPVEIGGPISVTFKTENDDGDTIPMDELDRFAIYVSGPSDNYQRVIPSQSDLEANAVSNGDGTMTYTFPDPFPSTYAAPLNDSPAFGSADGELAGMPTMPGTYTVGIEARQSFTVDGATVRDAGDATFDFAVGGATLAPRQVVLESNCEKCHNELTLHGSNRFSVTGCVLCHTKGAEDRTSSDPAKATPDTTILFANMIHRIHRGHGLPNVEATAKGPDPYRYEVIGYGESVHDFSDVAFPMMPGGTGFNQQTRNCDACHGGAAQGDLAYTNPTRAACTGCHDDVNFTTGTKLDPANVDVANGTLSASDLQNPGNRTLIGGLAHSFTDGQCTLCHTAGTALDPRVLHLPPLSNSANINGLTVQIVGTGGNSGADFFMPGDFPGVTFNLVDGNGSAVDISNVTSVNMVISGPVGNYQKIIPTDWTAGSTASIFSGGTGKGGVPNSGTGPFTYSSTEAIPANYPVPSNDSAAFDYANGWGELGGRPLVNGSYTIMVYAYRQFTVNSTTYRESSLPGIFAIRIGSSGSPGFYPGFVTDAKCNGCHGNLRFHGNTRRGVMACVTCHVAGAEDRANVVAGQTQAPEADTIDWKVMIHKIHNARELNVVKDGGKLDIVGYSFGQPANTGSVNDFSTGILPTMPGEAKHCAACHATDAWKTPVERTDVNIWKVACLSCHDSTAAATHAALNTLAVGQEACATCHGDGAEFSVEKEHAVP